MRDGAACAGLLDQGRADVDLRVAVLSGQPGRQCRYLLVTQGLFETLYVENNIAYNLDLHLQRLTNSINCLFPLDATNFNLSQLKTQIDLAVKTLTSAKQVLKILMRISIKFYKINLQLKQIWNW